MAEQITHKKGLKRLDKDKRLLLKQYYQLDDATKQTAEQSTPTSSSETKDAGEAEGGAGDMAVEVPEKLAESTLDQLLQAHNLLLGRETAANNSIKNTIYDNYYDLVKVNQLLREMGESTLETRVGQLADNLRRLRKDR
ncbi:AFR102Cp [Eremothecium gossypii ATCC 10895]|uniref:AFR102Cp n=1 Tax=Eremothecium gossypii (strain ATCC 10895 / CBS 109.51 / FGSC 9923 / NRRL Y-1056) TaxID=284811 RepID=Q754G8_EREGS|nr:AFR102Cp [Eremothecium gossypii ATCC 10895]AAS53473.1 AFR102Cp [Eremothecium gossypii ATCC 10895]AEY97785.1 FAFR102Cp [Eremothecium gossypii FDAG1]